MARRDAVMARSTLGRIALPGQPDRGVQAPRAIDVDPFGHGAGGLRPPSDTGPGGIPTRQFLSLLPRLSRVKLPGDVTPDPELTPLAPAQTVKAPSPPRAATGGTGGGTGGGWTGGGGTRGGGAPPLPDVPDVEPLPDLTPEVEVATPAAAPPKHSSNLLMYAAIGFGVWLLLQK
jgi:hypothetical protein